ncbi:site-specific integrase [Methylophilus sp. 14]|uniref:site-specific integrase n=1 Tax=Methylophilus sp. 14 TaxID=2781019 RepID=UPI00188FB3A7|nr:site-specific integrase [Methylophilus sp. 14]MBF4989451.1 tyrosine-type recombinase/integrase [Methylophilus sp. 14]
MISASINTYNLTTLSDTTLDERQNLTISPKSKYKDDSWDFSSFEENPNVKPSASILRFDFKLQNGQSILDARYEPMRAVFKEIIYAIASSTHKKLPSPPTLKKKYTGFRFLFNWMSENKFTKLDQLRLEDINEYIIHVKSLDLHPMTKVSYVEVLGLIWEHRKQLNHGFLFDPLKGKSPEKVLGIKKDDYRDHKYDFIPDSICQDLIRSSVNLIREKGADLVTALLMREDARLNEIKKGTSKANKDRAKIKALEGTNFTNYEVTELARQLLTCCYIIIIFFTGIRASEMLTLGPGRIEQEGDTTWIHGRLIKIKKKRKKWMAPKIVYEAFILAQALTKPMRNAIDYELSFVTDKSVIDELETLRSQLFLGWSSKREHGYHFAHGPQVSNVKGSIHTSLKEIVEVFNLTDEDGSLWNLHPHQFRKSFVRFMCARVMNIRYLQEHLGHTSLDMTAWYDTDDVELTLEIESYLKELKVKKLYPIFEQNQNITGAAAESIHQERQDHYNGIVSLKARESFIQALGEDVTLRSTGHSWCMSDSTNGNCTGVVGCMMDISMTQKCKSALITVEHLPAWHKKREQYESLALSSGIGIHQKDAIKTVLNETIYPIIKALSNDSGVEHGRE